MMAQIAKVFLAVWCLVWAGLGAASIFQGSTLSGMSTEASPVASAVTACIDPMMYGATAAPMSYYLSATCTQRDGFDADQVHKDLVYRWEFGNERGETYSRGSEPRSSNIMYGPQAYAEYIADGSYVVTLWVWDPVSGDSDSTTTTVTLNAQSTKWSGTQVFCVRNDTIPGGDGCPAGATAVQTTDISAFLKSAAPGGPDLDSGVDGGPRQILLRAGQTFTYESSGSIKRGNLDLATYGPSGVYMEGSDAARAFITKSSGVQMFIFDNNTTTDRITDIRFRNWSVTGDGFGQNGQIFFDAAGVSGDPISLGLVHIQNFDATSNDGNFWVSQQGPRAEAMVVSHDTLDMTRHVGIFGTDSTEQAGAAAPANNHVFMNCERCGLVDNQFGPSVNSVGVTGGIGDEHTLRLSHFGRGVVSANSIGERYGANRNGLKANSMRTTVSNGLADVCANNTLLSLNLLIGSDTGSPAFGELGAISSNNADDDERCIQGWIVENNHCDMTRAGSVSECLAAHYGKHVFRNNTGAFDNSGNGSRLFNITRRQRAVAVLQPDDDTVKSNSVYSLNSDSASITVASEADRTIVLANSHYTAGTYSGPAAGFDLNGANMTTADNVRFTSSPFVNSTPTEFGDFKVNATGSAQTTTSGQGLDAGYRCRNRVTQTVGAWEDDSNIITCPWESLQAGLITPSPTLANSTSPVGMGTSRVLFDNSHYPFANMMKQAGKWQQTSSGTCGDSPSDYVGTLNSQGIPTDLTGLVCVFFELFNYDYTTAKWPTGQYKFEYTGTATWNVVGSHDGWTQTGNATNFTVNDTSVSSGSHALRFELTSGTPTDLALWAPGGMCSANASAPYNPNKFSHALSGADCDGATPNFVTYEVLNEAGETHFRGDYLNKWTEYRIARMMDWQGMTGSLLVDWVDWTAVDQYSYELTSRNPGTGDQRSTVPAEVMAEMCDVVGACWIHVPTNATDAHITSMANYFRDNTESTTRIVLEYGNEHWNVGFVVQFDDTWERCSSLSGTDFDNTNCDQPGVPANFDNRLSCNRSCAGRTTVIMADLWETSFAASGQEGRLEVVFAGQAADDSKTTSMLECDRWLTAPGGSCAAAATNVDGFAVASYFGSDSDCTSESDFPGLAAEQAIDITNLLCNTTGGSCYFPNTYAAMVTAGFDRPMYAYEGGSHSALFNNQLCMEYNKTVGSGIREQTQAQLDALQSIPDGTQSIEMRDMVQFHFASEPIQETTGFGYRDNQEDASVKESAVIEWIRTSGNECNWLGC